MTYRSKKKVVKRKPPARHKLIIALKEAVEHAQGNDTGARTWAVRKSAVHHPSHYGGADNPYEAIKVLEARMTREEVIGYLKGSVYTYNDRAIRKGNEVEDYEKGAWFQNRLVQFAKGNTK